ncbi:hypothetical protein MASR2M79_02960 [Aminivibrio sp.]
MNLETECRSDAAISSGEMVSLDRVVLKIKACAQVPGQLDPDFILNARTDAIAVSGVDESESI